VIKKGGKAAATFFLSIAATAVANGQTAKDCQRMMGEVKGADGARGDRDARIAGAIGRGTLSLLLPLHYHPTYYYLLVF
jgi:hypothetical protein